MSTHVARVGSCCNQFNVVDGMFVGPYKAQEINAYSYLTPRVKQYSGWANYKNVKSGQYNRQPCWTCGNFKSFPQTPGTYNLNISDVPPPLPNYAEQQRLDRDYQAYQAARMSNNPGKYGTNHVNYLNGECGFLYPKRYVKGNWPDEQLIYTNAPSGQCNKNNSE